MMAYKEKTCPKCSSKHNKRGEFCSRSCGNSRKPTEEHKQAVAEAKREWHKSSDTAQEVAHNFISKGLHKEPEPIAPPAKTPLQSNQFIQDGDIWTEV